MLMSKTVAVVVRNLKAMSQRIKKFLEMAAGAYEDGLTGETGVSGG
jgi:hypothetical protein